VACFYYRAADRYASLFVVPVERLGAAADRFQEAPQLEDRQPHRLTYWTARRYAYVLVSDVSGPQLLGLAQGLRGT
jgi:hypothetical protein